MQSVRRQHKEEIVQLAKRLYSLREEPAVEMFQQLLARLQDETRDALVTASPQDFQKLQGKALAYKDLYDKVFNFKTIE